MSQTKLDELITRLHSLQLELEHELEQQLEEKRQLFQYTLEKGKINFKKQIRSFQREHKKNVLKYLKDADFRNILSSPFIYSMIIPLASLDICITVYQHICFRLYGIPRVKRSKYLIIDRQYLVYLNTIEKLNCMYCGYGNGVISYSREVIARTEQYWCPIKHAKKVLDTHHLARKFVDYGDAKAYKNELLILRNAVTKKNA